MERGFFSSIKSAMKEAMLGFSVSVTVLRYDSYTGGGYDGTNPHRVDRQIPMRAKVWSMSQVDHLNQDGFMQVGDLKTLTVPDIIGFDDSATNVKQGDMMVYDGFKYLVKGKPAKTTVGGRVYTEALWRKI